jgi:peptidoglycan/LPS O-acetylase OafA/YrhL
MNWSGNSGAADQADPIVSAMMRRVNVERGRRPLLVTIAAAVLVFLATLNLFAGTYPRSNDEQPVAWIVFIVIVGLAQLLAATMVFSLKRKGRRLAEFVAAAGFALNLSAVLFGGFSNLIGTALNGFVLYALSRNRGAFSR